jgi:hypothetical protein
MMTAVQACTTKEEARELVKAEVAAVMAARPLLLEEQGRSIVLHNIGYLAGYLDRSEAARLLDLFETRHPFFGAMEDWPKTPEETIAMGMKVGMQAKRGER